MHKVSRRQFIQAAGASAAVAALACPAAARAESGVSRLNDIDHFIILMQENRSFDHYFGTLSGVRGYGDPRPLLLPSGRTVFFQPDTVNPDGYVLPFRLDTTATSAQRLHDLSHAWDAQHDSLAGGAMDGWVKTHREKNGAAGPLTMGYYTREDLPFHYALADAFTICDGYYCSVLGPTYPNRLYYMTASIDAAARHGGPVLNNDAVDGKIAYTWETYPERLERAGISWQVYFDMVDDYALNILRYFKAYRDAPISSPLHQQALVGRPFAKFLDNVRTGNLPQVTWVLGHAKLCEHPAYLPAAGADFIHSILQALWSNPSVWARTAFILNYDENDGQFDHVVPPSPAPGTAEEFVDGRAIGLGFRVPCIVASPFSRGGYVCSDTFDHTSTLRLLETRFGVEVPNLSAWRRATTGDLTAAFGFDEPARLDTPVLPETVQALARAEELVERLPRPEVPLRQSMPSQEPGVRPRRGSIA
ncbi:MAG TPA: alkaline phosphatase family protein [Candidatus Baltobacteraceae bacterium]|nr:alkaline phosphatase family protein [Candidatus Baltobacteraceae bacterium]